ncbi:MAG: hypothetical protein LBH28_01985 [Oscillospiraceae bacterium]|jgi:ABC-type sugar transport system substrate-binding protein|nr:hypothetical protein [Oscillospiraceae bacterium]
MKKILALVLALTMVFVFVAACDNNNGTSSSPPVSSTPPANGNETPSSTPPSASPDGPIDNAPTGEIGMYDPNYNYSANKTYKIIYLVSNNTSGLYTESGKSFAHWASMSNVDYQGLQDFAGDTDAFFSSLPQLARDYDGIIMDADATMYDRVYEVMEPIGTPWMSFMGAPRDDNGLGALMHPYIGFEQYDVGAKHAEYLYEKAKVTWPSVPMSDFGFISVDWSVAPPVHARETGAHDKLMELDADMATNRYFVADAGSLGPPTSDNAQQLVSTVLSMNPGIKYWIIFGEIDDLAQGAAAAIDLAGLTDTTWVTTFGGTALQQQWDAGRQDAWRSANFLPQVIFTEPIFFSLYAFMNGDATPETIFPEWKNVHEDTKYGSFATRLLPWYEILFDNYKHMLKWSDVYAGSNIFPDYSADGISRDDFSNTVPIPANYK